MHGSVHKSLKWCNPFSQSLYYVIRGSGVPECKIEAKFGSNESKSLRLLHSPSLRIEKKVLHKSAGVWGGGLITEIFNFSFEFLKNSQFHLYIYIFLIKKLGLIITEKLRNP